LHLVGLIYQFNHALDLYSGTALIRCKTAGILSDAIHCFIQTNP